MATDVSTVRAREWLERHRLGGIEPSALLVARLKARRRSNWTMYGVYAAYFTFQFVRGAIDERSGSAFDPDETDLSGLAWFVLSMVVLILGYCAGLWHRYRLERRLLAGTRTRSAHPVAAGPAWVLGTGHLAATVVVYGGGLLLGAVTAVLASRPSDRLMALAFLGSVALLAALSFLTLAAVLRRPSVAEDAESLLVDDVLRNEDARDALTPLPLLVAVVLALGSTVSWWLFWSLLGYAAVGFACWLVAHFATSRTAPTPVASRS